MRCTIKDFDYVYSIVSHDQVWPFITDDLTKGLDKELFIKFVLSNDFIYCLSPGKKGMVGIFYPTSPIVFDAHQLSIPELSGKDRVTITKEAISWMFSNTSCLKLEGKIPVINKRAIRISILYGWEREGVSKKSFLDNGVLVDQIILGIEKEKWTKGG